MSNTLLRWLGGMFLLGGLIGIGSAISRFLFGASIGEYAVLAGGGGFWLFCATVTLKGAQEQ